MPSSSKLILFVSIDIVGSTAFKNKNYPDRTSVHPWLSFFQGFPEDMRRYLSKHLDADPPQVWKSLGDELVYTQEISRVKQITDLIDAFRITIGEYNKHLRAKKNASLGVKGTAWIAGFPVINTVLEVKNGTTPAPGEKISDITDYLGPSIDIGFRITKLATRSRFIVSVDLAMLLARNSYPGICFGGTTEHLKGVFPGRHYPIFWVEIDDDDEDLLGRMTGTKPSKPVKNDIEEYCKKFIERVNDPLVLCEPYLCDSEGSAVFGEVPPEHTKIREEIEKEEKAAVEVGEDGDQTAQKPREIKSK